MGILAEIAKRFAKPAVKAVQPTEELGAKYLTKAPGPSASGRVFTNKELQELRDQLAFYTQPRNLAPENANSLQMLLKQAEEPGVKTHVLYTGADYTEPAAAFQLTADHELDGIGNYMPNLVTLLSGTKGIGTQALQEARRSGPFGLVNTPHSRPFYDKVSDGRLPGFGRYNNEEFQGVAHQYKADGGLVRYSKGCKCHG